MDVIAELERDDWVRDTLSPGDSVHKVLVHNHRTYHYAVTVQWCNDTAVAIEAVCSVSVASLTEYRELFLVHAQETFGIGALGACVQDGSVELYATLSCVGRIMEAGGVSAVLDEHVMNKMQKIVELYHTVEHVGSLVDIETWGRGVSCSIRC